jgi:integrase
MAACRSMTGWMGNGVRRSAWWTALHLVLWDTGERIGAVLTIRWEWVNWQTGDMLIPAEFRKGQTQDMEYRLHATTLEWLQAIQPLHETLVFGEAEMATIYRAYKYLRQKAGVASDSKSAFHRMRRSVASHLHALGHNATDALKHSSEAITRGSYLDPAIAGAVRPSEVLFRPEGSQEPPPPPACELDPSLAWL